MYAHPSNVKLVGPRHLEGIDSTPVSDPKRRSHMGWNLAKIQARAVVGLRWDAMLFGRRLSPGAQRASIFPSWNLNSWNLTASVLFSSHRVLWSAFPSQGYKGWVMNGPAVSTPRAVPGPMPTSTEPRASVELDLKDGCSYEPWQGGFAPKVETEQCNVFFAYVMPEERISNGFENHHQLRLA